MRSSSGLVFRRFGWVCAWVGFFGAPLSGGAAIKEFSADLWKNSASIGDLFTPRETRSIQVFGDTNAVRLDEDRVSTLNKELARLAAQGWRPDEFKPTAYKLGPTRFYEPENWEALKSLGGSYVEVVKYLGFLPDSVVVPIGEGETIPLWLPGLEAQIAVGADPNTSLFHFQNPVLRLEALGKSWDQLSPAQREYVAALCERMSPLKQLASRFGLSATLDQHELRKFLSSLEKEILEGSRDRAGPFLPLELRGVVMKADAAYDISIMNVERPAGIWIAKGESALGIRPLAVSDDGHSAEVDYLQTRWTLPVLGRSGLLSKPSADLVRKLRKNNIRNLLQTGETELSFTEITRRARLLDARLEQAQAISTAAESAGTDLNEVIEQINRFTEESPELRLVDDDVLEFLLTAETARQAILAR